MSEQQVAYHAEETERSVQAEPKPRAWRSVWTIPGSVEIRCRHCMKRKRFEAADARTGKLVRCDVSDARRFARTGGWKQVVGKGWFCPSCVFHGRHED